jgi:hypothetical protein
VVINKGGEMLGYYLDSNSVYHGFLLTPQGQFTEFDAPNGGTSAYQGTQAAGLTDDGAVAGTVEDSGDTSHGFLRGPDGSFTEFDAAGGMCDTYVSDINSQQTIVGLYVAPGATGGFLRSVSGEITSFGDWMSFGVGTINTSGVVTGNYYDAQQVGHSWVRAADGNIIYFDAPGAGKNANQGTFAGANNDSEEITGDYVDSNGVNHGFIVE